MGSLTKQLIGKEDCDVSDTDSPYDTFSRLTSTGSTMTMTSFPDIWKTAQGAVNALYYGSHDKTGATLTAAVGQTVNNTCKDIYVEAGEWVIDTDYDWSTYTTVRWIFASGAYLSIATGCKVTFPFPDNIIAAPTQQIFSLTGTGTVAFANPGAVYVDWWQFNTTQGTTDMYAACDAAADSLPTTGGTILFVPGAKYAVDSLWTIAKSNITIDGQGATVKSASSATLFVYFNGDSGTDGDWTSAVRNCFVRNFKIGDANDTNNVKGGVYFYFAIDCGAENIEKRGLSNTSFQLSVTQNCYFRNIWNYGANTSDGKIGFLTWMSDNALVDNCHIRDAAFVYGFQAKGGIGQRITNCSAKNIKDAGSVTVTHIFRLRGDAPYGASSSTGTYPYSTLAWGAGDTRRETQDAVVENCHVYDCDGKAFKAQESANVTFKDCSARKVDYGVAINRISGGSEKDFILDNIYIDTTDVGYGIALAGQAASYLPGVRITNCKVNLSYTMGFYLQYCERPIIATCEALNSGQGTTGSGDQIGMDIASCNYPHISSCNLIDDQGAATASYGLKVDTTSVGPIVQGCRASGAILSNYSFAPVGFYRDNSPPTFHPLKSYTNVATSGTGEDDLFSVAIPADTLGKYGGIRLTAYGIKAGANGNKTIKLHWGSTSWTVHAAANNTNDWRVQAIIVGNKATNSQKVSWTCMDGTTLTQGYEAATEDTTAAVTLKLTGECANAGDTITQAYMDAELF